MQAKILDIIDQPKEKVKFSVDLKAATITRKMCIAKLKPYLFLKKFK